MVSAIITKTVQTIKALVPDLNMVHFWTDFPSSQYRNKLIFDMIVNFENLHGCKASWHSFESGACEELGDLKKRNADMAVKQSQAVIQDAHDFLVWTSSSQSDLVPVDNCRGVQCK